LEQKSKKNGRERANWVSKFSSINCRLKAAQQAFRLWGLKNESFILSGITPANRGTPLGLCVCDSLQILITSTIQSRSWRNFYRG